MANWAWPHTPSSNLARMVLRGGPFHGEAGLFVPPDTIAPAQIVWCGWIERIGFRAWLYQWDGEVEQDRGRTDALVYRATGRHLAPDEIPPLMAELADLWSETSLLAGELALKMAIDGSVAIQLDD